MKACAWQNEWTREGVRVVDCETCGFKHQYPIPPPDAVEQLYSSEYYSALKPDYQRIIEEDEAHFRMWALSRLAVCEELLPPKGDAPRRILDVGSSYGQTLKAFRDAGWETLGVEPSPVVAQYARRESGLAIQTGLLEDLTDEALSPHFDVVHMAEVINHMRDPIGTLERIHTRLLRPGGVLVIETSNDFNAMQEAIVTLYGVERWWIVPDHVTYFDRASLTRLLERSGYNVHRVEATFPMEIFPLMGDNYLHDSAIGKACHRKRVQFELNLDRIGKSDVRRALYGALAEAELGRSVIVYASRSLRTTEHS